MNNSVEKYSFQFWNNFPDVVFQDSIGINGKFIPRMKILYYIKNCAFDLYFKLGRN